MNDERQKRRNYGAVSQFREHWRRKRKIDFGGPFPARVRVRYRGSDRKIDTQVHIHSDARVYIQEAEWFNAIDHYTEMNPDFQIYTLTKRRRALRVRSDPDEPSDKLGVYKYDIRPLKRKKCSP